MSTHKQLPDKQINEREEVHVEFVITEREHQESKARHYLVIFTLLFYVLLLALLVASWVTGQEVYLDYFSMVFNYLAPIVVVIYGDYLFHRMKFKLFFRSEKKRF